MILRAAGFFLLSGALQDPETTTLPGLLEKLHSESIEERDRAAEALLLRGDAALPLLEKAAAGADPEAAARARKLIEIIRIDRTLAPGLRRAMPDLARRLAGASDFEWRKIFLEATDPDRNPPLRRGDPDALASRAVRATRDMDDLFVLLSRIDLWHCRSAVPELIRKLSDEDFEVRRLVAAKLGRLGDRECAASLEGLLEDPESSVRTSAMLSLASLGVREAAPAIARHLGGDRDERVAVEALVRLGARETAPAIARLLYDSDDGIRPDVVMALGELGAVDQVPSILPLLEHERPAARIAAAHALGLLGARGAIPGIAKLLAGSPSPDWGILTRSLVRLEARDAVPALRALVREERPERRYLVIEALGRLGAREAVPDLLPFLKDPDPGVDTAYAARAIGVLGAAEARDDLAPLLSARSWEVRTAAAGALYRLGRPEALGRLLREISDPRDGLFFMNEFRQPEAWKRLERGRIVASLHDYQKEVLGELARQAGMTIEWPADEPDRDGPWLWVRVAVHPADGSLLGAIASALASASRPRGCEVVLEADRLRVLPMAQAVTFWREWWAAQPRKNP